MVAFLCSAAARPYHKLLTTARRWQVLYLDNNKLVDLTAGMFIGLSSLSVLSITDNGVTTVRAPASIGLLAAPLVTEPLLPIAGAGRSLRGPYLSDHTLDLRVTSRHVRRGHHASRTHGVRSLCAARVAGTGRGQWRAA